MSHALKRGPAPLSHDTRVMAAGTLLSRLTGVARLFALAYALGIGPLADAYNLANNTPNIIYDLILGGVVSATLIPVFVDRVSTKSEDDAFEAISAVVTLAIVVLIVATVVFAIVAPFIIGLYTVANHASTASDQRAVATYLLRLFAPQVAFYGLISLATALLNTRRRFAAPMWTPILNNLVVMGIVLGVTIVARHPTLASIRGNRALLLVLGLGTTLGVAVQALALLPSLRRAQLTLYWRWAPRDEAVKTIVRLSGWTFGFVASNQIAFFIVTILADHLGVVSAYTYAYIFFQLPYGIIAVSIMSALQPDLAERWSTGDTTGFRRQVGAGLRAVLSTMIPAAVGYIVLSKSLVSLLLGHGAAGSAGVHATSQALTYFAFGLPGFASYLFLMRVYQAMQDTRSAFYLYLLENGVNVVLALALVGPLGVRGLSLSLSIAYTAATIAALLDLRRRSLEVAARSVVTVLLRSLLLSILMGTVVLLVAAEVGSDHGPGLLVRVVVSILAGVTVFILAAGTAAQLTVHTGGDRPKSQHSRRGRRRGEGSGGDGQRLRSPTKGR